jgi:hypothetical protein
MKKWEPSKTFLRVFDRHRSRNGEAISKKRPRDEHTPSARSATSGAESPALSVAADQQRNLQAEARR